MYANLDPRTEQLAIDTLDQFYAAGGTLPIVFESSKNINSWAIAAPNYFDFATPKQEAVAAIEKTVHPATYGLTPGQPGTMVVQLAPSRPGWGNPEDSTFLCRPEPTPWP